MPSVTYGRCQPIVASDDEDGVKNMSIVAMPPWKAQVLARKQDDVYEICTIQATTPMKNMH